MAEVWRPLAKGEPKRTLPWIAAGIILAIAVLQIPSRKRPPESPRTDLTSSQADHRIASAKDRLTSRPDDFESLEQLAIGYYYKGPDQFADALNAIDKARSLGSTNPQLFYYAGVMFDALGLADYAVNELSKYLRHFPKDYEALVRLANLYFRQNNMEAADVLYREALKRWPHDPTVWFNYAVVNRSRNNLDEATKALEETKKLAGHLPRGGFFEEGEIARLKGDDDRARALYTQELDQSVDYLPAAEALEAAQKRKGLTKEARETRKRIQEIRKIQKEGKTNG